MLNQLICIQTPFTGKIASGCPFDGLVGLIRDTDLQPMPSLGGTALSPHAQGWGTTSGDRPQGANGLYSLRYWHCQRAQFRLKQR